MSFVQWEFPLFAAAVIAVYWLLPGRRLQNLLLMVVSAVFYGWVHPWFLLLLYFSAGLDYTMGRLMAARPQRKTLWLVLSLSGNLGMLGYFKYAGFFVDNVIAGLSAMGVEHGLSTLHIFLPVGISFYTFQTMSYTIDIYQGKLTPRRNLIDYLAFVSFFPQLVAGPVERASRLLPQLESARTFDAERFRSGLTLVMWGAFTKVCIADTIAPYVDQTFALSSPSWAMIWAATAGFTVQILADFSGYTNIARGLARMMGLELVVNFRNPYIARSPSDFWRRWHISFSTWIRDYLYIPLGGSRYRIHRATFTAMLLSGLWHGASWTFVLWGGYHAMLLTAYRKLTPKIPASLKALPGADAAAIGLMFCLTMLGWLIFRETDLSRLLTWLTLPPLAGSEAQWMAAAVTLAVTLACATPLVLALMLERTVIPRLGRWTLPSQTTLWAAAALAVLTMHRSTGADFIYFQF